jgi:hypothetical protein
MLRPGKPALGYAKLLFDNCLASEGKRKSAPNMKTKLLLLTLILLSCYSDNSISVPNNLNYLYGIVLSNYCSLQDHKYYVVKKRTNLHLFFLSNAAKNPEYFSKYRDREFEFIKDSLPISKSLSKKLFFKLIEVNRDTIFLPANSDTVKGYKLVSEEVLKNINNGNQNADQYWTNFYNIFHNSMGIVEVSIPVFDKTSGYYMIYIGEHSQYLAGTGYLILFNIDKDKYTEIKKIMIWIS